MTCCFDKVRRHIGGSYGLIRFSHFSIILAPRCRSAFATHRLYFSVFLHVPVIIGYLVGLAQVAGGLAILTGLLFRIGAACIIIVMIGAIFLVHISHGFDVGKGGFEYALTQLVIALSLFLTGPGVYSLAGILPSPLRKL